ncbi:MAG: MFS transporter [Acidobacteria bacterium]|nr:MFS transporter [Acidobacteriota bacterium]
MKRPISNLRWWIGGVLFASTVINYIDRQTLSVLAPYLKSEFRWTNSDFAVIVISFRVAYAVGQSVAGRLLDWLGTRRGLTAGVLWYSAAAMLTSLATGLRSFAFFRFLLGTGEAANWPGATKAVSEWFPKSERGLAVALFDSGSAVGGAVAPALVVWLYAHYGSWRPVFVITGTLGLLWLCVWRWIYHRPEEHPRISEAERAMILSSREEERAEDAGQRQSWLELLRRKETWGIVLGRGLTDPVWFFVTDWFAIYLVSKGYAVADTLVGFWVPFLAADAGNFAGGWISGRLVQRGWSPVRARKAVIAVCGLGMALIAGAVLTSNLALLITAFGISTFCYAAWSTMGLALPTDLFPSHSVATVSGMGGTGAGVGTIVSTYLIGWSADRYSFEPVLLGASVVPLVATALVWLLIQERGGRDETIVLDAGNGGGGARG